MFYKRCQQSFTSRASHSIKRCPQLVKNSFGKFYKNIVLNQKCYKISNTRALLKNSNFLRAQQRVFITKTCFFVLNFINCYKHFDYGLRFYPRLQLADLCNTRHLFIKLEKISIKYFRVNYQSQLYFCLFILLYSYRIFLLYLNFLHRIKNPDVATDILW